MPDLVKYPLGHELEGQIIWYDEITGQPTTDAAKMNAGATRLTTVPNYYGDTWLFNHTRCPESCNNHGFCNLNFCVCKHEMPQFCNNHMCVAPTFWGSFKPGTDKAQWGYHCGSVVYTYTQPWNFLTRIAVIGFKHVRIHLVTTTTHTSTNTVDTVNTMGSAMDSQVDVTVSQNIRSQQH